MSLLSKAKAMPTEYKHNQSEASAEMIELAIAYAKHEVTMRQISKVLGTGSSQSINRINHAIRSAIRTGKLVLK